MQTQVTKTRQPLGQFHIKTTTSCENLHNAHILATQIPLQSPVLSHNAYSYIKFYQLCFKCFEWILRKFRVGEANLSELILESNYNQCNKVILGYVQVDTHGHISNLA